MMETKQESRAENKEIQEAQKAEARDTQALGGMDSGDNNGNNGNDLSKASFGPEAASAKQEYIDAQRQQTPQQNNG